MRQRQIFFLVLGLGTAAFCTRLWTLSFLGLISFTWWRTRHNRGCDGQV